MNTLTNKAQEEINKWGKSFNNPAAAQGLIDAASRSPYLRSQLDRFFANGGELRAPQTNSASAEREGGTLVLKVGAELANGYSTSALGLDQLATVFAHELGHALSPGGLGTGTLLQTQAVGG
jgi:hypothetical protein